MGWIIFAGLAALFDSLKDLLSKQSLQTINPYLVAWSLVLYALPLLWPLVLITGIPPLGPRFWEALLVGSSINVVAMILYIKALQWSDLSLTVPLITLTPLFLLFVSPAMVGEHATRSDLLGIVLIVTGAYLLNIRPQQSGWFAPFKALWHDRGARTMLIVAGMWSFSAANDKIGVQQSSPSFWVIALFSAIAVGMVPLLFLTRTHPFPEMFKQARWLIPIGLLQGLTVLVQMQAIQLTLVSRVIAIKRMSALLSVLLGSLILKEKGLKDRLLATGLMVLGVVCLTQ
jgi:uncharacterized membrane protein